MNFADIERGLNDLGERVILSHLFLLKKVFHAYYNYILI